MIWINLNLNIFLFSKLDIFSCLIFLTYKYEINLIEKNIEIYFSVEL
jgi:hypothetical protein